MKTSKSTKKPINVMATSVLAATMLLTPLTSVLPGQNVVHAAETQADDTSENVHTAKEANRLAESPTFPDVPNWAKVSVDYLVKKGALHGKTDGRFAPMETIDRGSTAKIMAIILGLAINPNAKPSFQDAQNHWAAPYIAAVEKVGVIKGDGTGNFNPTGEINRASMASMLVNAYNLENQVNGELVTQFEDLKGHWGERYANILVQTGISKGTDKGWAPDKYVTRAEAAQFIAKADIAHKEEVKPEVKEEVKPEVKEEVKPEVKEEVKPEVKEEVKPEVKEQEKQEAIEQEFKKLQETYDGFFTDKQHNTIEGTHDLDRFLEKLELVEKRVPSTNEKLKVALNNMKQKTFEIWLERQFHYNKESIEPRFEKLQETYDGFFTDEQHNIIKEVKETDDLSEFLKELQYVQRSVLSAKEGNSESQEYFSKMEVVLNNMKPTVEKLFTVRYAPIQKKNFGQEFQELQETYGGFFIDGEKTTLKLPVHIPSVFNFISEVRNLRVEVNTEREELVNLGIEVEKGFNLETAEYYAQMEGALIDTEKMAGQVLRAEAVPNMKKNHELTFKEIQKTYDEFFTDEKKTTLKLPVDSKKFDRFKKKVEILEEEIREAKEIISNLRIEVKKGSNLEALEYYDQMEVALNNMQQTLLKIYDQSGNEEAKPAK